jgi:hypothetical protein
MIALRIRKAFGSKLCAAAVAAMLVAACTVQAQEKPKTPAKPAAKAAPAAKGAAPAGAAKGPTTSTAGRGPTTSGPTTAGRGPTTSGPTTAGAAGARGGAPAAAGARGAAPAAGARAVNVPAELQLRVPRPVARAEQRRGAARWLVRRGGDEVRRRADGRPGDVHVAGRNMDIHHGLGGGRRVEVERADHSRIVAERGGRGYVQHPYACIAAMSTVTGPTTNTAAPTTGSTHGIRITALYLEMYTPAVLLSAGVLWVGLQSLGRAGRVSGGRVGLEDALPGLDSTAPTSRPIRCIRAHRSG